MYWVKNIVIEYADGKSAEKTYLLCDSLEEFTADTAGVVGAPCVWDAQTGKMTRAKAREEARASYRAPDFKKNPELSRNVRAAMEAAGAVVSATMGGDLFGVGKEAGLREARELIINKIGGKTNFHTAVVYIPGYESIFDGTITKNPPEGGAMAAGYALAYCDIAMAYYINHDYQRAIEYYSTAITIDPAFAPAYYNRGSNYFMLGDFDNALKDITHYLSVGADAAEAYLMRGRVHSAKGEYDRAIADYNEALRIEPDNAQAKAFIADAQKALHIEPDSAQAYLERGSIYYAVGDYNKAIADYSEALRIEPDRADAYLKRGSVHYFKGDCDRAIADFTEARRIKPNYEAALWLARAQKKQRNKPSGAYAYLEHGIAYWNKGDYDRAIAEYTEALRINPNYATAYKNRGYAYFEKGDYDRAIADFDEALRINPHYAEAKAMLADAQKARGQ